MTKWTSFCAVCGDQATRLRYSHYSAVSCFSCRTFFRRAVEKSTSYYCEKKDCIIDKISRKKCAACRFAKCKRVGMKHGIQSLNSKDKIEDPNKEVLPNDLQTQFLGVFDEELVKKVTNLAMKIIPDQISMKDISQIADLTEIEHSTRISIAEAISFTANTSSSTADTNTFFAWNWCAPLQLSDGVKPDLLTGEAIRFTTTSTSSSSSTGENSSFAWNVIKNVFSAALSGQNLAFSTVSWTYTIGLRKLVRFSLSIPEFANTFHGYEKKSILLHNLDPMFNIKSGFFFQSDGNSGFMEQVERLSVFDTDSITKCREWIPFQIQISNWIKIPSVRWNQYFISPWANSMEHEHKYEFLMVKLSELKLDFQSACLLSIVALFSSKGIRQNYDLSNETIAKMGVFQLNYSKLLFRYICHTHGKLEAEFLFPKYMEMLANLREMSDIMQHKTIKNFTPFPTVDQEIKSLIR